VGQESVVDGRYLDGFRPDGLPEKYAKRWSEAGDSVIRQHWPDLHLIAELTDRTVHGVESRGYALGLKKPAEDKYSSTVDTIAAMWREGHTATQIAKQVGAKSRAAILGKLNRLGLLGGRPKQQKKPREHLRARNREAQRRYKQKSARCSPAILPRAEKTAWVSVPPSPDSPPSLNLSIIDVKPNQCRHIAGDDHRCCGNPIIEGTSWCDHHYRVVYWRP
jgi:GcrA cell cycle regulator